MSGLRQWQANQRAMRHDRPLPATRIPGALVVAITGLTLATLAVLVVTTWPRR